MENNPSKFKVKKTTILLTILLIASLGLNAFFAFKINTTTKEEGNDTDSKISVCENGDIEKYNNGFFGEDDQYSDLKTLKKNIEEKEDYEKDVNCVMILYGISNRLNDKESEIKNYKKLKEHTENGNNPSLKITNVGNIDYMNPTRGGSSAGGPVDNE